MKLNLWGEEILSLVQHKLIILTDDCVFNFVFH